MLNLFQHPSSFILFLVKPKQPCTYILASQKRGTLYIGVTSDLPQRIWQHRHSLAAGFASRYRVFRLVHAEFFDDMAAAIKREKQLKNWHRPWKLNLIEEGNPDWCDLAKVWGIAE